MKQNMGAVDRIIRIILAIAIVTLYFTDVITGAFGVILMILAGVFVFTSLFGICLIYLPFGMNTRKNNNDES